MLMSYDERIQYIVDAIEDIVCLSQLLAIAAGGKRGTLRQLGVASRKIIREIFGNDSSARESLQKALDKFEP